MPFADSELHAEMKPIPSAPGYQATSTGKIWSAWKNDYLKLGRSGKYPAVTVCYKNTKRTAYVHVLVAETFIGARPPGLDVNHKNGIRTDNRVSNLEYVTRSYNVKHAYTTGLASVIRGENHTSSKLTWASVVKMRSKEFSPYTHKQLATIFNISPGQVRRVRLYESWRTRT